MRRFTFTMTVALVFTLGLISFPRVAGHTDTLPHGRVTQLKPVVQPSPIPDPELPDEVQAYVQFLVVDDKEDLERPMGAGVCVERSSFDFPFFGEEHYCRVLSVAHVCVHIALDDRHEGGDIHGNRFPVVVSNFHPFLDLCMVVAFHEFEEEMDTLELNPERYGEVYNYSAPLGVFEDGELWLLPMFTGRMLGYVGDLQEHLLMTTPIHQGSSGSAVYQSGDIVGVVTQRNIQFEHYSYVIRSEFIAQYLYSRGVDFSAEISPERIAPPPE